MQRGFAIIVIALLMSCSDQDSADSPSREEGVAINLAAAKCGCLPKMPWLRELIRQAQKDPGSNCDIYAIKYSGGVAVLHQPWISSCLGCLTYDCDGNKLTLQESARNEIISAATIDNIIFSSF